MPHHRGALIDQLRALLTKQRFNPVVIHNYCRNTELFVEYVARRDIAADAATPDHVSGYLGYAVRRLRQCHGHPAAPRWESIPGSSSIHARKLLQRIARNVLPDLGK